MNRKLLIVVATTAFLWGLLTHMPARVLTHFFQPQSGVELYGLQGTLIDGQLDAVVVRGRPLAQNLHWTLKPLWLLLGQRVFAVSAESADTTLQMQVRLSPFGTTTLSAVQSQVALTRLMAMAGQTYMPIDGHIQLDLDTIVIQKGHLSTLTGTGQIRSLNWTLSNPQIALGDFDAKAATENNQIRIEISSPSGPVDAQGQVQLASDGRYQVELQYRARAQADPVLRNLIAQAGTPDTQGWIHYRSQGQF